MLIWQSRGQASISQAMKARPGVGVNGLYGYPSAKAVTAAWMNSSGTAPTSSTPGRGMAVKGVPSAAGQPVNHRPLSAASVWLTLHGHRNSMSR